MAIEAKFSDVVDAVRAAALDEDDYTEFGHQFISEAEQALRLDFSEGDWLARQQRDKFCGQVKRALDKLAADGVLVKTGEGRGNIRYWSPAAHEAHQAREAEREAARQAVKNLKERLMLRIGAMGLPGNCYVASSSQITMDLERVAALLDRADGASS